MDTVKKEVRVHGVRLAYVDEGSGPAVVLLHGYPDSSRLWRKQIPELVDAGFRVVAPDLRGFGDSDKPPTVDDYTLTKLLSDVVGLMSACDIRRAHVVGHDWGATLAWMMASLMPRRVTSLTAISVGHPRVFHHPSLEQRQRFWYVLLYQFEGVAEELIPFQNFRITREFFGDAVDIEHYIESFQKPDELRAGLNLYRANRNPAAELDPPPQLPLIEAPTLGIWSSGDRVMLEESMLQSAQYVTGPWEYQRIEGASHWVPLDAPREVSDSLIKFLRSTSDAGTDKRRRRL